MFKSMAMMVLGGLLLPLAAAAAADSPGPRAPWPSTPLPVPRDRPYPGSMELSVDASDLGRRIVHVHEHITGAGPDLVLLYPQWLPGAHAPEGAIDRVAGLRISTDGRALSWSRDPVAVYAFHVQGVVGHASVDVDFDYLSPTSGQVGDAEIGPDLLMLEWIEVVLYPAGYFARDIPVAASMTLPPDWKFGSALEAAGAAGGGTQFKTVSLETLLDSPVYAGRYASRLDLDPGAAVPVHLDVFADRPELLALRPEQLEAHRALVRQAYKLFASHHYAHYDFLYSLSEEIHENGLEHHQSSEDGALPESFTEWDTHAYDRDLLSHEFTHSWNGKFRRPADLWTPNYNVPMQDSLLWVYEGQTQYWGEVLAARAGLRTRQQALDELALTAAYYDNEPGRRWRPLEDTTNDEILNQRRPLSWRSYQRFEDYYSEGALIWLDADTLIRERSRDQRSLDDFAKAFFGVDDGSFVPVTYTFDDVVKALNAVEPYDWRAFLRQRLDTVGKPAPLDGIARGGYKLVYSDTPSDYQKNADSVRKRANFMYSIGVELNDKAKPGTVSQVQWDGPAFQHGITEGMSIIAVNGVAYSADRLKDAIRAAHEGTAPIELILKRDERFSVVTLDYHGGLRYPHLEREQQAAARLDTILAPR